MAENTTRSDKLSEKQIEYMQLISEIMEIRRR